MTRWTAAIGLGLAATLAKRRRRLADLDHWIDHTRRIQLDQLRTLLRVARHTELGREARFYALCEAPDEAMLAGFRGAIRPGDYETWRARLARMREAAEPDVTWPGVVRDWAQTSGTTGGEKYIPVSESMMASNRTAALDIFAHAANRGVSLPKIFAGKLLFLGGSTKVTVNEHGVRTGDLSGLVTPLISWPLSEVYTPGKDVALLDHWPTKIGRIASMAQHQDVRFVSGMASWSLVLFERLVAAAREEHPRATLRDVWPNFELYVHGGVRYPPFDPRVRAVWSGDPDIDNPAADVPHRLEVYPASEGFIAMQDAANPRGARSAQPPLRLNTDIGLFFEFVPAERINDDDPPALLADEVTPGQRYVVLVSSCAGLWRYILGDVVVFDAVPRRAGELLRHARRRVDGGPPRLRIVGRHRHFVNAFGENLIVEEIENAAVRARDATGVTLGEFTAAPVYPASGQQQGGLELVAEFDLNGDGVSPATLDAFAHAFDDALRKMNVDYNTKRTDSLGMTTPTLTPVPMGAFDRWMESRGKLGGQNKVPRCANHRDFVDGLRGFASSGAGSIIGTRAGSGVGVGV